MAAATTRPPQQSLSFFTVQQLQSLPHLSDYLENLKTLTNPLDHNQFFHPPDADGFYLTPSDVVLRQIVYDLSSSDDDNTAPSHHQSYHRAGPRKEIFFDPDHVRAAIVTCGGLCPGLNTVIRELVVGLWELYGVREIFGVKSGYRGFYSGGEPVPLNPKLVHNWHKRGGTALETSRGGFDLDKIVNAIQHRGFNQMSKTKRRDGAVAIENEEREQRRSIERRRERERRETKTIDQQSRRSVKERRDRSIEENPRR